MKNLAKYFWRGIRRLGRTGAYLGCLAITLFVVANSYEIASGKDVPFLSSVHKVNLSSVEPTLSGMEPNDLTNKNREGNYGMPTTLRLIINEKPLRVILAPGIKDGNHWLARANTSHVLFISEQKAGNAGDMIIYTKQSWRTIPTPEHITAGTNMFIETNAGWRYMFRAQDIRQVGADGKLVIPETRDTQMVLIIDQQNGNSYVVFNKLVSLQRVGQ